jgi:predicted phosphodiesterase
MNEYLFEDRDERSLERIADSADCDVLVFGHTHIPWTRMIRNVLFINAGSAGKPKDGNPQACWVMVSLEKNHPPRVEFHRVSYDVARTATAICRTGHLSDHYARDLETGGTL